MISLTQAAPLSAEPGARAGETSSSRTNHSQAGLTLGLTRAGVPADIAVPIALAYRFTVFHLPPKWGFLSFEWLTRHRYL